MSNHGVLYKNTGSLKVGDVHRYIITYTPNDINKEIGSHLYIRVKNIENLLMNSVLLTAPYMIYCDIRSSEYSHNEPCFITDDQPIFEPNLIPGQSLIHKLTLNKLNDKYVWIVDIISQIIFSTTAKINFELLISNNESDINKSHSNLKNSNFNEKNLMIQHLSTIDIWNKPPKSISIPIHLVILVHGLHSNTTADMFYMMENIEKNSLKTGENIVLRSFNGNVCKTERGIKYLGRRLAEFIVKDSLIGLNNNVEKISFIAHSLGGPVQTFAISYINFNYPDFFEKIKPENFITMASPLLGISNENPAYVKMFLKFGIVGKTGQDLNLDGSQPLLLLLPSEPTRKILKKFKRRTVYANVLNDGIVPLRTSALLYLDWKGLSKVYETINSDPSNSYIEDEDSTKASIIPSSLNSSEEDEKVEDDEQQQQHSTPKENTAPIPIPSTDFVDSIKNKIQSTIDFCLPGIQQSPKTTNKYNFFQTTDLENSDNKKSNQMNEKNENESLISIPKSSAISSIKRVLLPPTPSVKYINDPKSRYNVILHDKIYKPDMIPKKYTKLSKNIILSQLEQKKRHRYLEEKIARRWHQGMSWRKVLVYLQPDAHNNMIVRRRFSNAYGWQVIDHMIESHFSIDCYKGNDSSLWKIKKSEVEGLIDIDDDESNELNKKLGQVMSSEYVKESKRHHIPTNLNNLSDNLSELSTKNGSATSNLTQTSKMKTELNSDSDDDDGTLSDDSENNGEWLNESASGYYDGPTGLLNSVNEGMIAWKDSVLSTSEAAVIAAEKAGEDVNTEMKELNEVGDLNAYI
ncbi:hypothetical protein C6P40_004460 [Pichia californica]|uniref:DUF676 domain-containing protein n=1 Tax=Pichia californica TaxID=460514 RepID=A0A9P6WMS7_9ASCO|nr:hypothetical protein C6P40_004460 [[Candida] californica]